MSVTKEQILKMIQEEVDEEIREGFFSRLFGGGDDEEEKSAEEAPAEEEPEEEEGPKECDDPGAVDFNEIFKRVWKGRETRMWKEWPEAGGSPYQAVHDLLATLTKNPNMTAADAYEVGTRYRKYGSAFDFHRRFLEFQNALRREPGDTLKVKSTYNDSILPCMEKRQMVGFLSSLADGADRYSEPPEVPDQEGDWAYGKGSQRISRLEEVIREEISKVIDDLNKEDK